MAQVIVQKLHKREDSQINLAIRYFTIMMAVSDVYLTKKELELLAYTSLKGNVSSGGTKTGFIELFNSSEGSLYNLKHSLTQKGLFVKRSGRRKGYDISPELSLDFSKDIVLQVTLDSKTDGLPEDGEDKTK